MPDSTHSRGDGAAGDPTMPGQGEDFALVQAFLAGDLDATQSLAERLQVIPRMLGNLCRRFNCPMTSDELDDVGQDAVAIALRKLKGLGPEVPLDAWLYRLCSYELSNAVRKKRRTATRQLTSDLPAPAGDALQRLEQQDLVLVALEQLNAREATIVRLHHLDGLTFVEIATRLDVTENAVKGRYYRAIEQLTVLMSRHHPNRST